MNDLDLGHCFLHFSLYSKISDICNIDHRHQNSKEGGHRLKLPEEVLTILAWVRWVMELKLSLYYAYKAMKVAGEIVFGDRHDLDNIFQYSYA